MKRYPMFCEMSWTNGYTVKSQHLMWDYDELKGEQDFPHPTDINVNHYVEAIKLGMDLARKGYDDIYVQTVIRTGVED